MKNITRWVKLAVLTTTVLLLAGCSEYVSLYPLYDDSTLVIEPSLNGSWKSKDDDVWTFVPDGRKYNMTMTEPDEKPWEGQAGLVRISGRLFLDVCGEDSGLTGAPAHIFVRIRFDKGSEGNRLEVAFLEPSWMDRRLAQEKDLTSLPKTHGRIVLIAPTTRLQDFFRRHASDEDAFTESEILVQTR